MGGKQVRHRGRRRVTPLLMAALVTGMGLAWGLTQLGAEPDTGADAAPGVVQSDPSTPPSSTPTAAEPSSPSTSTSASASGSATPVEEGQRSGVASEAPTGMRLPSGTTVPVRAVTTRADGVLDVPDDIRTAGWWRGGSRLGDPFGSTLIAAHIDSHTQGLGPYVELLRVEPRARIVVRSAHLRQVFRVTSLSLVPRESLAGARDIFSVSGPRRLVLVTCAGPFDPARGGYQNLAVVTGRPVGPANRRAA